MDDLDEIQGKTKAEVKAERKKYTKRKRLALKRKRKK